MTNPHESQGSSEKLEATIERTFFYEGARVKSADFENFFLGYFRAFKSIDTLHPDQKEEVKEFLLGLAESTSFIAGDLNTTPVKLLKTFQQWGVDTVVKGRPSYLFPLEKPTDDLSIPAFDNFVVFDRQVRVDIATLTQLPDTLRRNPRDYMREKGIPSDHIPVVGTLRKDGAEMIVGIYNMADPVFWSGMYPGAGVGFDMSPRGEAVRQSRLMKNVETLLQGCNVVSLCEVPSLMVKTIEEAAKNHGKLVLVSNMQNVTTTESGLLVVSDTQPEGISRNILIY